MTEEDCGLFMFPDSRDNSNGFSVVDRHSIATSGRIAAATYCYRYRF